MGEIQFTLGARAARRAPDAGRRARVVRQELRLKRVTVSHERTGVIEMTCLVASEVGAPARAPGRNRR